MSDTNDRAPDLFERVARAMDIAYFEWIPGEDRIKPSLSFSALFDVAPEDFSVPRMLARMHPDDLPGYRAAMIAFLKSDDVRTEVSYRYWRRDGGITWARNHFYAERDASGRVTRLTATGTDITKEKEHEAANRALLARQAASVEVLRAITASPDDPQPVFELIIRRACELCNAQAGNLFEYDGTMMHVRFMSGFAPEAQARLRAVYPRPPGEDTLPGRVILSGQQVHLPDAQAELGLIQQGRGLGARAFLGVPLLREGRVMGVLALARFDPGEYDQSAIELVQSFAEQAVIAITNANTLRELRERDAENRALIARREATIEVLRAISDSPADPQPVFELIARRVRELYGAHAANVVEYDGSLMHIRAMVGHEPEATARLLAAFPRPPGMETGPGRAILSGQPSFNRDPSADNRLIQAGREVGGGSYLGVPLLHEGGVVGVLGLWLAKKGEFNDALVDIAKGFAEQAVIAIAGAKTLRELRERTAELAERNTAFAERIDHQAATIDVLRSMAGSPGDPQPVFDLIVRRAAQVCGNPSVVFFELEDGLLHLRARVGDHIFPSPTVREQYLGHFPMALHRGSVACRTILDGKIIHVRDVAADPELSGLVRTLGTKSVLGVPVFQDGNPIAVIGLNGMDAGGFTDTQIALMETFAEQAAIAIASAATYRALQTRTVDLQESLEQQTATSDVLKVISRSTFDLDPVLETLLTAAARLCDADSGTIATVEGDHTRTSTHYSRTGRLVVGTDPGSRRPITRSSIVGRTALEGRIIHVEDVGADPEHFLPGAAPGTKISGTMLGVPLLRDGVVIGVIRLARDRVDVFTDRQVELVRTFADQAVIAIENTRLLTEQREALEQQTATAEVLGVINANPGNPQPAYEMILDKAHALCGAVTGGLMSFDGTQLHILARHGFPEAMDAELRRDTLPISGVTRQMLAGARFVHTPDVGALPDAQSSLVIRAMIERTSARTFLAVPLCKDGAYVGQITAWRDGVNPFAEKEIALLESFAAQAVIAMENARLLNELRESLERQTAMAEVLEAINASPGDLAPVYSVILRKARELCGLERSNLQLYDGEMFRAVATDNLPAPVATRLSDGWLPSPNHPFHRLLHGDNVAQVPDLSEIDDPMARFISEHGRMRSILAVALRKDGALLGMIVSLRREVRLFTDKEIALLENFAAQAVIAMENARLLNEIRERQGELDVTFQSMVDGVALFDETHHLAAWNQHFRDMLDVPADIVSARPSFTDYIQYLADRGEYGAETGETLNRLRAQVGQSVNFERTRPNGQTIQIRTNPTPAGGFVVMYTDITERKRAEEVLRATRDAAETALRELRIAQANLVQAEKMASLGQLTAGIAHEIKNPLNFVNNFAALSVELLDEFKETAAPAIAGLTEDQRADIDDVTEMLTTNLRKIEEHGKRADGIVRAMLEHSRGASTERRTVDINGLVDEALNLAYHGARAQDQTFNITLERDFTPGIAPIEVNPQDLTRVFLNIFGNGFYAANKRMRENGGDAPALRVTTRGIDDAVEVRVRDNGTGIPPDIRDKLFQPFFTTKPTGEGTGLGLSITYDIVTKAHGGTIAVESEVGVYTEFVVTLPRHMFAHGETTP